MNHIHLLKKSGQQVWLDRMSAAENVFLALAIPMVGVFLYQLMKLSINLI